MLAVGAAAPPIDAPLAGGGRFVLAEALEQGSVYLYFFPKSFTPL